MKHSILFDAGPEESAWRRNVERLGIDVSIIEVVTLSHWHRDHSRGLLEAIRMIRQGKKKETQSLLTFMPIDRNIAVSRLGQRQIWLFLWKPIRPLMSWQRRAQ